MSGVQGGPCCFCGKEIVPSDTDPCRVMVTPNHTDTWQAWFCHAQCFKDRLAHPDGYPDGFFAPARF